MGSWIGGNVRSSTNLSSLALPGLEVRASVLVALISAMEKLYSCVGCAKRFKVVSTPERPAYNQHEVEMNAECPFCCKTNAIVWPQGDFPRVVTEDGNPPEGLGGLKMEILSTARQLVAERLGVIPASRKLAGLRHYVEPDIGEMLLTFAGIDSETDTLPIGAERKEWNRKALERKDREIWHAEQFYRDTAIKAATELIRLLERPS